jgi:hypothetical protein
MPIQAWQILHIVFRYIQQNLRIDSGWMEIDRCILCCNQVTKRWCQSMGLMIPKIHRLGVRYQVLEIVKLDSAYQRIHRIEWIM